MRACYDATQGQRRKPWQAVGVDSATASKRPRWAGLAGDSDGRLRGLAWSSFPKLGRALPLARVSQCAAVCVVFACSRKCCACAHTCERSRSRVQVDARIPGHPALRSPGKPPRHHHCAHRRHNSGERRSGLGSHLDIITSLTAAIIPVLGAKPEGPGDKSIDLHVGVRPR